MERQVGTRIGSWFELSAFSDGRSMQMPWIFQAWSRRHRVDTSTKDKTHCIMSATRSSLTSGLGQMPLVISHNLDCKWPRSNMIKPSNLLDPSLLASWSNGSNGFIQWWSFISQPFAWVSWYLGCGTMSTGSSSTNQHLPVVAVEWPCRKNSLENARGDADLSRKLGRGTEKSTTWISWIHLGMGQNPIPLVNIKIAGKWMFIPQKKVCIGIDP